MRTELSCLDFFLIKLSLKFGQIKLSRMSVRNDTSVEGLFFLLFQFSHHENNRFFSSPHKVNIMN